MLFKSLRAVTTKTIENKALKEKGDGSIFQKTNAYHIRKFSHLWKVWKVNGPVLLKSTKKLMMEIGTFKKKTIKPLKED